MGRFNYDSFTIGGLLTSGGETTAYSNKVFNGFLHMIQLSTGSATTGALSTTGAILLKGEVTGINFVKFQLGTPPTQMFPLISCASSSGALLSAISTGYSWGDPMPLVNERLIVQTSGGSSGGGVAFNIKVVVEGSANT
ncbi:MAG: hypothetical protein WC455_14075 [Dehalococcoidia bacterium]|jgi:hypothetical protein